MFTHCGNYISSLTLHFADDVVLLPFELQSLQLTRNRFRVLTGWLIGSQILEVAAFDDLHGETASGGIVNETYQDLWRGALALRLEWRRTLAGHLWDADLGLTSLETKQAGKCTEADVVHQYFHFRFSFFLCQQNSLKYLSDFWPICDML